MKGFVKKKCKVVLTISYREYILQEEELSVLRGKLNIQGTIR